jgi:N-acyl-D-amino-acid deacylase
MAEYDTIIRGGTIVDGTGMPRFRGDIGIVGGRVAAIDGLRGSQARQVLDASGLIVAPGFVDLHTHYDAQLFWDPYCTISGWHGITSVVIGNCGFGFAPCRPEDRERSMLSLTRNEQISYEAMQEGLPWDWESFPEFLDSVDRIPKGVNVISYAPLSPIIAWAMGGYEQAKDRWPSADELKSIQRVIHEAMDAGACGWSVQRLGENSAQPDFDGTPMITDVMTDEEGYAFAEVLRERGEGAIQLTYVPISEGNDAYTNDAVFRWEERLAEISGRPVLHNVAVVIAGAPQVHKGLLTWLQSCHDRGLQVYGQGDTIRNFHHFKGLAWNGFDIAPAWKEALMGTPGERLANLRDPMLRQRMVAERPLFAMIEEYGPSFDDFEVLDVGARTDLQHMIGRTLGTIAAERRHDVLDTMIDLALATDLQLELRTPFVRVPDAGYTAEMIRSGLVVPGVSDGGAHSKSNVSGSYTTDFLTWLVRDNSVIPLEQAHQVLSALPARIAGFKNRGTLVEGAPADIVIYDLEKLQVLPTGRYEKRDDLPGGDWRLVRWADGYRWTIVNGQVTFEDGVCTNATPGRLLRHGRA